MKLTKDSIPLHLRKAIQRLGTKESPLGSNSDGGQFIDSIERLFGLYRQPWCAILTSVMTKGLTYPSVWSARALDFGKTRSYLLKDVLWKIYIPKPGDWLVWSYGGGKGHVDIVVSYDSDTDKWILIGGNRTDAVRYFTATTNELILRNAKYVVNVRPISKMETTYKFDTIPIYATWYGGWFHSKKTASGEKYDTAKFTAAHRTLKFNTVVKVYNPKTKLSVFVRINDRCPKSNVIDLTPAAARKLKLTSSKVKIIIRQIAG